MQHIDELRTIHVQTGQFYHESLISIKNFKFVVIKKSYV